MCVHFGLSWANKKRLQQTIKNKEIRRNDHGRDMKFGMGNWEGDERLPVWLYGQFYVNSKVLKWNCNSLKNNSVLKDTFVLHKIWFEKFESLSFPLHNFWRQIDIIIGNFRYKTVKYTVWKRWIDGLNIKNCNVVWRKVFYILRLDIARRSILTSHLTNNHVITTK